jgi:hypothetical protein
MGSLQVSVEVSCRVVLFAKRNWNYKVQEDEVGGARSATGGRGRLCIGYGMKTGGKETTRKTKT